MKKYIGVKMIEAEPMSRGRANGYEGWDESLGKSITEEEFNAPGYKVVYPDGYKSWSPKDVFEKAYRLTDGMTFGLAIEALKEGKKIGRDGWDVFNVWLKVMPKFELKVEKDSINTPMGSELTLGDTLSYEPYIMIKASDDRFSPWQPQQSDMLAEDWIIIE